MFRLYLILDFFWDLSFYHLLIIYPYLKLNCSGCAYLSVKSNFLHWLKLHIIPTRKVLLIFSFIFSSDDLINLSHLLTSFYWNYYNLFNYFPFLCSISIFSTYFISVKPTYGLFMCLLLIFSMIILVAYFFSLESLPITLRLMLFFEIDLFFAYFYHSFLNQKESLIYLARRLLNF